MDIGADLLEMTSPGQARLFVLVTDTLGSTYNVEANIVVTLTTTGPFSAAWDPRNRLYYRNIVVTPNAPGTGLLIVSALGVADTISLKADIVGFKTIAVADGFACGLALDGRPWCWGDNGSGQLGSPTPGDCNGSACQYGGGRRAASPLPVKTVLEYATIATGGAGCAGVFESISCGATCVLRPTSEPSCWGYFSPAAADFPSKPVSVVVTPPFTAAGNARRCFLLESGAIYCLARRLPLGATEPAGTMGGTHQYKAFDVGRYHACGVRTDGDIYCWGSNLRGNLGLGTMDSLTHESPQLVVAPEKFSFVEVGDYATCGLSVSGKVFCWGIGYSASGTAPPPACLGSNALCQTSPRLVEGGASYSQISMSATRNTLCGLSSSGAVDCWDTNRYNFAPTPVAGLQQPLRSISVGGPDGNGYFKAIGCGVSTTDVAWCWSGTSTWKVGQ